MELTPGNAVLMVVKVPLAASALGVLIALARLPAWTVTAVAIAVVLAGVAFGVRRSMFPND